MYVNVLLVLKNNLKRIEVCSGMNCENVTENFDVLKYVSKKIVTNIVAFVTT